MGRSASRDRYGGIGLATLHANASAPVEATMALDRTAAAESVPHRSHSIHTSSIARRMGIGALLVLVGLAWTHPSLAQKPPAPRGELRIVDKAGGNWSNITFNVMDHLVELDKDGKLVPRLA